MKEFIVFLKDKGDVLIIANKFTWDLDNENLKFYVNEDDDDDDELIAVFQLSEVAGVSQKSSLREEQKLLLDFNIYKES